MSPFVASDFVHLVPVGSLLLLADFILSIVHLVCLPEDHGGLWRVWPFTRVKILPKAPPEGDIMKTHSHIHCG